MIANYGNGLFRVFNLMIDFKAYRLLDFHVGFSIGRYVPLSLRLGWYEVSFFLEDDHYQWEDYCDEECCN